MAFLSLCGGLLHFLVLRTAVDSPLIPLAVLMLPGPHDMLVPVVLILFFFQMALHQVQLSIVCFFLRCARVLYVAAWTMDTG